MGAVRLRNVGEAVHLYAPPDSPNSLPVDRGQVVTVAGPLEEIDDAWICGEGDAARAFPKSQWGLEQDPAKTTRKSAAKAPTEEAAEEKGGDA